MVALWLTAFGDGKSFAFELARIRLCNDVLGDVLMLPDLGHSRSVGVANIIAPTRDVYGIEFSHDGTFSIVLTGDSRMYVHPRCGSLKLNLMSL